MFKAAIFDLDGTLIETEYLQWQGWADILKPFGVVLSKNEYLHYGGKSAKAVESELVKKYKLNVKEGELRLKKEALLLEWFRTKPIKLTPYAREAVEHFIKKGWKVGLITGGPRPETVLKLERSGLLGLFKTIVTRDDVKRGKPYPDVYILGMKKLGVKPGECVAFEDTQYGLQSAKAAKVACVAIPQEYSAHQDFSKADAKAKDLKEAVDWVDRRER
jgi:HAD superfamily hydrolase (TIGR01509 family)